MLGKKGQYLNFQTQEFYTCIFLSRKIRFTRACFYIFGIEVNSDKISFQLIRGNYEMRVLNNKNKKITSTNKDKNKQHQQKHNKSMSQKLLVSYYMYMVDKVIVYSVEIVKIVEKKISAK